jgi:uncharacterized membrane protein
MKTDRLNAFTDGVLAIVITIMVLELPVPHGANLAAIRAVAPLFAAYALSFVNVGIFWNNHHHLMSLARHVDGRVLWANSFLLFWLSLIPFVIRWIGEAGLAAEPVAAYGVILTLAAFAYMLLEKAILAADGEDSKLASALGAGAKEWLSFGLYVTGIALSFVAVTAAIAVYVAVSAMWLIPDPRVERMRKA